MLTGICSLALALTGCATAPRVTDFPRLGFTVTEVPLLHGHCDPKDTELVVFTTEGESFEGCVKEETRQIFLDRYEDNLSMLLEKFCRMDGTRTNTQCAERFR